MKCVVSVTCFMLMGSFSMGTYVKQNQIRTKHYHFMGAVILAEC